MNLPARREGPVLAWRRKALHISALTPTISSNSTPPIPTSAQRAGRRAVMVVPFWWASHIEQHSAPAGASQCVVLSQYQQSLKRQKRQHQRGRFARRSRNPTCSSCRPRGSGVRPRSSAIIRRSGSGRRLSSAGQPPKKLHHAAQVEVDNHLVVLHALASFNRSKAPQKAVMTIAHPS